MPCTLEEENNVEDSVLISRIDYIQEFGLLCSLSGVLQIWWTSLRDTNSIYQMFVFQMLAITDKVRTAVLPGFYQINFFISIILNLDM